MNYLSLPKDITAEQMIDVMEALTKDLPLDDDGKLQLDLDAMILVEFAGSRVDYCRALARLANSGLY